MTRAKTAIVKASKSCPLISNNTVAARVNVSARTGVAVRGLMYPNQAGANLSSTRINARRDVTIKVGFSDEVMAMIAPRVTRVAPPHGKYTAATSVIGAALDCKRVPGNTPNATIHINTQIKAVALIPYKKISGKRRVLSLTSPAV